ncbi:acyl-CoA dehydrogenase family protein [Nocardia sp. NPDC059239]|uniref:acyl-CoA dehydrogenase family protein n=1 Tax=unclassified Nocardia TaxID=2637762 RepID=UPI003677EA6E
MSREGELLAGANTDEQQDTRADALRAEIRAWLAKKWDSDMSLVDWRRLLIDEGWAVPSWPREWLGRGLPRWADAVVAEEIEAAGAVGNPLGAGTGLAAPTILAHGSNALRKRFLRPILTGEETWCQLFSEPGAGSDLAGLVTSARLDGDEWVISGQKVWNTSADHADFGLLLARTDTSVPKHQGLTYFALPMRQPGVEVRPLLQMNGHSSFNEVFLSEARIPAEYVVGEVNGGWSVALTTLQYERRFGAMRHADFTDRSGKAIDEAKREAQRHAETYKWYPQRAGRVDLVLELARSLGRDQDPIVRQEIAKLLSLHRASAWTAERARIALKRGARPSAEGSLGKLANSQIARQAAAVHSLVAGTHCMLSGPESLMSGVIAEVLVSTPAQSIAGGTDQIQRNIVGEKMLGLPKEPSVETGRAFRDVRRGG